VRPRAVRADVVVRVLVVLALTGVLVRIWPKDRFWLTGLFYYGMPLIVCAILFLAVDHIWVRRGMDVNSVTISRCYQSDHHVVTCAVCASD